MATQFPCCCLENKASDIVLWVFCLFVSLRGSRKLTRSQILDCFLFEFILYLINSTLHVIYYSLEKARNVFDLGSQVFGEQGLHLRFQMSHFQKCWCFTLYGKGLLVYFTLKLGNKMDTSSEVMKHFPQVTLIETCIWRGKVCFLF